MPLGQRHLERTREWSNDPELARLLGRSEPVSREEHHRWSLEIASRPDRLYMAVEHNETGQHIGNVWLWAIDGGHGKAEVRIVIGDREHIGRGAGTESLVLMSRYACATLGLHRLYAYVLAFNQRALRAFTKAGFAVEGVLKEDRSSDGVHVDVYALGRLCAQEDRRDAPS